jgi:site-specific DNA-methyltransferase (adenine-specific)
MLKLNKVYFGDCLKVMNYIDDKSINMILCDLPYGSTRCKWDVIIPFEKLWSQYNRIIKNGGVIALFGNEPFSSLLRISNLKRYKYDWIWDKVSSVGHLTAKKRPLQQTENICIFYNGKPVYNPQMCVQKSRSTGREYSRSILVGGIIKRKLIKNKPSIYKYPTTLLKYSKVIDSSIRLHPTQKSAVLLEYLIKTYTNENDLVLDNCAGSGSIGLACLYTNRNFILIENNKEYFNIIKKRIYY